MLFKEDFNQKEGLEVMAVAAPQANTTFEDDEVAMGCSTGCWDGCIGTCRRFQH